jgi:hypothetical protein
MKSTCITKERKWLMQVECKWCSALKKDNFKHKLYTAHKFWEDAPLPSLQHILWLFAGAKSKCHFLSKVPKLGLLLSWNFGRSYIFQKKTYSEHARAICYSPQKNLSKGVLHYPIIGHLTPSLRGFMVKSQIPNLIPNI